MFQSVSKDQATLLQKGDAKNYCPNCGMNLPMFYKTNHAHEDHQYCSMHCLFEATKGNIPEDAKVVDTTGLAFIDAKSAFYVVGSNVPGTMSMNSKYAFAKLEDAKAFMAQNGGEIMRFQEAYKAAGEDFQKDSAMIKHKRESGVYAMGQKLYENTCQKVDPKSFKTVGELKASLKSVCNVEQDKEYQAIALYLWDTQKGGSTKSVVSKINVPKDAKCPVCGMFVAKSPQWAAMIEVNGKAFFFDGAKDMMKYVFVQKKHFDTIFVTNYYKLTKIDAHKAFYVIGSNVYGPMGTEFIPFASEEDAQTFAKDHNGKKIVTFDQIDEALVKSL
jgi:nitrous oxide reductase accessory protein NosL